MIFRLRPAFVLLALCAAPAAFAADMALRPGYGDSAEPAETPAYDWSGPSLGLQGGWTAGSGDKVGLGSTAAQLPSARDLGDLGLRGGSVGLRAGYDVQSPFSHWVAGAAADLTFDGLRRSIDGAGAQGLAVHASARVGWDASLRARVGYAMDRLLIYATAGLATTREKYRLRVSAPLVADIAATKPFLGATIGVGAEYAFMRHLSVGLEYRYTAFAAKTMVGDVYSGLTPVGVVRTNASPNLHRLAASLNWRF